MTQDYIPNPGPDLVTVPSGLDYVPGVEVARIKEVNRKRIEEHNARKSASLDKKEEDLKVKVEVLNAVEAKLKPLKKVVKKVVKKKA